MDSPFSSPTKALNPLSPERINQQFTPNSSLTSNILNLRGSHSRGLSDVQSKVAYLNGLASRGNSPAHVHQQQTASNSAALQRAILGREEAESALAHANSELAEAQSRERRISERLESLLEELQTSKERQAHERTVFEKEIRKARKEAFRAGSVVVKVQEDLKHARAEAKVLKDEVQAERRAKEQAKQEAFERAYAIAGLTEEVEVLKEQLRAAEANIKSRSLKAHRFKLSQEGAGRMSLAEGDLALLLTPTPRRPKRSAEDSVNSPMVHATKPSPAHQTPPKRQRLSDITPRQEAQEYAVSEAKHDKVEELERILKRERQLRTDAEDLIEFLKLECQFKRCSCRLTESEEIDHVHEAGTVEAVEQKVHEHGIEQHGDHIGIPKNDEVDSHTPVGEPAGFAAQENVGETVDEDDDLEAQEFEEETVEDAEDDDDDPTEEPIITFSPATGTFHTIPSPVRGSPRKQLPENALNSPLAEVESEAEDPAMTGSPVCKHATHRHETPYDSIMESEAFVPTSTPGTHRSSVVVDVPWDPVLPVMHDARNSQVHEDLRKIPLRDDDQLSSNRFADVPGTPISREEALAQIRARRGRTNTMKRSISAGESALRSGGMGVTPVRAARRIPGLHHTEARSDGSIRDRRDISAPIRMSYH
ncbi:uncharacterized protein BO95DRAFT_194879 [Aspergillus brunneoviolaceus CBS 621.78]|uniref:Uncharacterized protein n=1 Tax=Aspergillus brunneoviolaceus CBS 621.78 TaxID=1450534 RepID=A0ACD1GLX3_9EURO|nr:hypothetical protein BO95DRAFT_194879 [Aspergillus brunneoviolaceus CBS 621.78]RAH50222.1 hypothetical protein BO95DRAFT_194879 [Aspergillus brunneoviolaceus CBS 621.78]